MSTRPRQPGRAGEKLFPGEATVQRCAWPARSRSAAADFPRRGTRLRVGDEDMVALEATLLDVEGRPLGDQRPGTVATPSCRGRRRLTGSISTSLRAGPWRGAPQARRRSRSAQRTRCGSVRRPDAPGQVSGGRRDSLQRSARNLDRRDLVIADLHIDRPVSGRALEDHALRAQLELARRWVPRRALARSRHKLVLMGGACRGTALVRHRGRAEPRCGKSTDLRHTSVGIESCLSGAAGASET